MSPVRKCSRATPLATASDCFTSSMTVRTLSGGMKYSACWDNGSPKYLLCTALNGRRASDHAAVFSCKKDSRNCRGVVMWSNEKRSHAGPATLDCKPDAQPALGDATCWTCPLGAFLGSGNHDSQLAAEISGPRSRQVVIRRHFRNALEGGMPAGLLA